ncbi:ER membrane protein complex subunit Emc6 [Schizosaccharomyces pombe]|uniref:ER membrane protein complex subunit 6 n=1 Tax=Schizosaccharomyces pombe (strain 972 / ATCC 24843) TaxID=284812 RepID=YJMB_SCHPO|nr:uncharacterized protein SPCC1020.11c [Schizosaccharomyces pombe]O59764.2 RecName: Full=ER membrane protein complex subunit 6 [Schizosaccharomyces pombe 972h-]CAA18999.2 ER membrane protein complex subunit 6 (predicted) [Schizosaccharomyces pombe]|eukprot:NP_587948.2 uncharacterized protein SPCC1020.11c [Schizosaccharomyces pombe]
MERDKGVAPIVVENVAYNEQVVSFVRNLTSSFFGCAAGILGLTSYEGLALYVLGYFFVSFLLFALKMRGNLTKYYQPGYKFWIAKILDGAPSYVLTWTLFYSLVYVYE